MLKLQHNISVALIFFTLASIVNGRVGIWIKSFRLCDHNIDYDIQLNISIRSNENKQYLDGSVILKNPVDNNLSSNISVDILTGKNYLHVLSITEKKTCESLHKYMGEFIYDLERIAQLIPGMCPIPKGKYHVHNYYLDYQKITTAANFPFGDLRFTTTVLNKRNKSVFVCILMEGENHGYF